MLISDWSSDVCSSDLHDQSGNDEGPVSDTVDLAHSRADRRAEDHEVQRRRQHRGCDRLGEGAESARHLEAVDGADGVPVHARPPFLPCSRTTKISSSELSLELRSLKSMPCVASRRTRSARSEERRVGTVCVHKFSSRWSHYPSTKNV